MNWATGTSGFDEVFEAAGRPRPHYTALISILESFTREDVDRRERLQSYPIRRLGRPDDIAPLVTFLASDLASWITGQTISVSGGYTTVG